MKNTVPAGHFFSESEKNEIQQYFGRPIEQLDQETFRKILRELRAKYHPDNFEKFGDETVKQLATERFQLLERISSKIEKWWAGDTQPDAAPSPAFDMIRSEMARFSYREMKIEIRTADKDLKYHLFGTFYRWLVLGEKFKIPGTTAWLITEESYTGHSIGFTETIKVFLTFGEKDLPETIVQWLFDKIKERADALIIEGDLIPIAYEDILLAIKRRSFLRLEA